jgi:hypothetical protein
MSWFCPSCKKHLEESVGESQVSLEIEPMKKMYHRWCEIYTELAAILCLPEAALPRVALSVNDARDGAQCAAEKRQQWHGFMQAMRSTFPDLLSAKDVKNWNSLHARKVYYRGVVRRNSQRFVCAIEAQTEIHEDLMTTKRVPAGAREYYVLDWQQTLKEGEEVCIMAFPNPAVNERDKVSKIVRVLTHDDGPVPMQPKTSRPCVADSLAEGNDIDGMLRARADDEASLGDLADPDSPFADLMTWSEDQPKMQQPKRKAKPAKHQPRSCKQLSGRSGLQQARQSADNPKERKPLPLTGSPVFNSSRPQTDAKLHALGKPSMICPLSPTAAYFGD